MNNIPKYQGGGYLERLMGANIGDIQSSAAAKLAESQSKTQKKEKGFRGGINLLKGGLKFFDPTGGVLSGIVDATIDPFLRGQGYGGKASDIQLGKDYQIFGGKGALETARGGFQDSLDEYKQSSLMNALLGFGGSKVGGALMDKMPKGKWDWLGVGGDNPPVRGGTGPAPGVHRIPAAPTYAQGGMVQKYQNGGNVEPRVKITTKDKEMDDGTTQSQSYFDVYNYNGVDWVHNPGESGWSNTNQYSTITQDEMDTYRSEERTADVGSQYMATTSEVGLNEFLRTPAVANLVEQARAGNEGAMSNLVEMLRQQRPEMADKTNEELRTSLGKILPNIDLYGEGYQETLAGGATALERLTGKAQAARGQAATQKATSGIRTPGSGDTISEALYAGAEDIYSGMQKDIQTGFKKEFDPLAAMFVNPKLG